MSKTHRRTSHAPGILAGARRTPQVVAHLAALDAAGWRPAGRREPFAARAMPRDHELRIDLQTLFDDEPELAPDSCDDAWRLIGMDPDVLCTGADGLLRLTVA